MTSKFAPTVPCLFLLLAVNAAFAGTPNNWQGPYQSGWNTAGSWSLNTVPGLGDDVTIYTGGNDYVLLDTDPSINSLTLGGANNTFTSVLTDGGSTRNLAITNSLDIGQNGILSFSGGGTLSARTDSANAGTIGVYNGSTLSITGKLDNSGFADFESASTLRVNGDATNSGIVVTNNSGFGGGNTVNINGNLTNTNEIALEGSGDVANVGTLSNNNLIHVGFGSTLNLMNQAGGITDAVAGSVFVLYGSFNDVAGGGSGFAHLNSLEGAVELFGQSSSDTPGSGTLTLSGTGQLRVDYNPHSATAAAVTINGNVDNSGLLATGITQIGGGNQLNITGNLTNSGGFNLLGSGDVATIGGSVNNSGALGVNSGSVVTMAGLVNSGVADLDNGSMLQINGDATNSGLLSTDSGGGGGGNTLNITGNLTNSGEVALGGPGETTNIGGTVTNSGNFYVFGGNTATMTALVNFNPGVVDVEIGGTLRVNGDATNSGVLVTNNFGLGGGNTLNITGNLTNNWVFALEGPGDVAKVNGNLSNSGLIGQYYNSTLIVGGTLTNNATGQIALNGPGSVLQAAGGVTNFGSISVNNGSSIDPPFLNNGGTISIDSSSQFVVGTGVSAGLGYIQLASGTLGEFIDMSNFGVIIMGYGAPVTLDGTLAVLLQNGYNPTVGSTFEFIQFTPGELSGLFANLHSMYFNSGTEKWVVVYDNAHGFVELEAAPAPEPTSLLLLGSGLLTMGNGVRRRLKRYLSLRPRRGLIDKR